MGLQERLQQQKEEAKNNPEYGATFKNQLSKDEKKVRRKQILANIGASFCTLSTWLMLTCNWQALLQTNRTQERILQPKLRFHGH